VAGRRGRHTILPLVGDTLVELCLSTRILTTLVFEASDRSQAELVLEDAVLLRRGRDEHLLDGTKPGSTYNPRLLCPLLELLGKRVTEAIAEEGGLLRITFSDSLELEVAPSTGYESWNYRYPRSGRAVGGSVAKPLSVIGCLGSLK
jgi:Family of unknown function (DUF6188)